IENLVALLDRDTGEVLEIEDGEVVPIPGDPGRYDAGTVGAPAPLWARHTVSRPSLSEMVVPYGSTATNHWWKNAFDAGDVGLGKMANPLELGCECLGEIVYLDAVAVDEDGAASVLPQAVCLHEEDYG